VTRTGSSVAFYINGAAAGTATNSGSIQNTTLSVGGEWNNDPYRWLGYLSNVRISNVVRTIAAAPTAAFTSDANTVVLTCQSNRFIDNSTNAYTITRNGDVSVQAFSPFNPMAAWSAATYGGSGYFDGSGDYLNGIGTVSSFNFMHQSSALWTFECWVYTANISGLQVLASTMNTSSANTGVLIYIDSNTKVYVSIARGVAGGAEQVLNNAESTGTLTLSAWNHIAVTYDQSLASNNCKFYINGVASGTASKTGKTPSTGDATTAMSIGATSTGGNAFLGYMSGLRISNSIVYSSAFTPPTSPVTGGSLLLDFTNGGIYDATSKNDLETVGNAQISTTQSKFGGSSIYFDGTGDWLASNAATPNLYAFGTGDFTIEFWIRFNSLSPVVIIYDGRPSGTNTTQPTIYASNSGYLVYFTNGANSILSNAGAVTTNVWYHVALCRYSANTKLFIDGVQTGSTYSDTNNYTNTALRPLIGVDANLGNTNYLNGYIQDLRVTKGIARYTSNFTPPTTAFPVL